MEGKQRLVVLLALTAGLAGCGSGTETGVAYSTYADSESCMGCHSGRRSAVTGIDISEEWKASAHNTEGGFNKTGRGASCGDCHQPQPGHPQVCAKCHGGAPAGNLGRHDVTYNPEELPLYVCTNCHGESHKEDVLWRNAPQHFLNITTGYAKNEYRGQYVSSQYIGKCRKCHDPHNPTKFLRINREWAKSKHGNLQVRTRGDFKTRGTTASASIATGNFCVRCHTTTGFINYVNSGFSDVRAWGTSDDKTKQLTACDACHQDSYSFKTRKVADGVGIIAYFNYSSNATNSLKRIYNNKIQYPDAGDSNVCMPCHVGREKTGTLLKDLAAAGQGFTSLARITAGTHNLIAGSILFRTAGYAYEDRNYSDYPSFAHENIGMYNYRGTGNAGPCISCHMKTEMSHSFLPIQERYSSNGVAIGIADVTSKICIKCHTGSDLRTAEFLENRKKEYTAAVAAIYELQLAKNMVSYNTSTRRYSNLTVTDWEATPPFFGPGTGPNTMGASWNGGLLYATTGDPGAYVHNPIYVKRLIFDSIDWLYDGNLATVTNTAGYSTDVEAAINGITAPTRFTNEMKRYAINYLLGAAPGGGRP